MHCRRSPFVFTISAIFSVFFGVGCGGTQSVGTSHGADVRVQLLPESYDLRQRELASFGEAFWIALSEGDPERMLLSEETMEHLLEPVALTRFGRHRRDFHRRLSTAMNARREFAGAEFTGLCVQGGQRIDVGDPLGFQSSTWVFRRALMIAQRRSGGRVASWVEGVFVYTNQGFRALDVEEIERPRWEHSGIEMATCELRYHVENQDVTPEN